MIHFRPFRNDDPPALARVWNASIPASVAARPLGVHELDDHAFNPAVFERGGLIVAERDGRPTGFVHAGFGFDEAEAGHPLRLDRSMGVVAMLAVEPGLEEEQLSQALVIEAERYLRREGASVI